MKKFIDKIKEWFYTKDGVHQQEINKQLITIVVSIILTVISVIGVTFSAFVWSDNSLKNQNIVVGNIELDISSNSTSLGSALNYPVAESQESSLDPYTFTITNKGKLSSTYNLKIVSDTAYTNTLDTQYIYMSLAGSRIINRTPLSSYEELPIDTGILGPNEKKTYDLRVWLIENIPNSVIGQQWHGKIVLESSQIVVEADVVATDLTAISDEDASTLATEVNFQISNTESATKYYNINLAEIEIDEGLKNSNFKWQLLSGEEVLNEGNFINIGTNKLLQRNIAVEAETTNDYKLLVWYSNNAGTEVDLAGKTLNAKVAVEANDTLATFAKSESPVLTNTFADSRIQSFKIFGNSIQNGVPTPDSPVEIESVGDKTKNHLNIKHLANIANWDTAPTYASYEITLPNGTYYFKYETDLKNYSGNILILNKRKSASSGAVATLINGSYNIQAKEYTFTISDNEKIYLNWYCTSGKTQTKLTNLINDVLNNFIIEEGDTFTGYEPYGYKIPVETTSTIYDFDPEKIGTYPYASTTNTRSAFDLGVLEAGDYTIDIDFRNQSDIVQYLYLRGIDKDGNATKSVYVTTDKKYTPVTFTADGTTNYYLHFAHTTHDVSTSKKQWKKVKKAYLQKGTEIQSVITNIYLNEPLRKIGDYADYIDFDSGKVVRKVGRKELDGVTSGKMLKNYSRGGYITVPDMKVVDTGKGLGLSTFAKSISNLNDEGIAFGWGNTNAYFCNINSSTDYTEINALINKLYTAGVDTNLYYQLETPDDTESIELPALTTFYGTTILSTNTTIKPLLEGNY